jgi:hypothetical protein
MYVVSDNAAVAEHCDDLVSVCAALGALKDRGGLTPELEAKLAEAEAWIAEGDALEEARKLARRGKIKTQAKVRLEDDEQEEVVGELWADCMHEGKQDREAPVVKTIFEGGMSAMLKPALEAQTATVRVIIGKLEQQDVYEGPLRDKHVPALTDTADRAELLLTQRDVDTRALEACAARELAWKQRGNTLRAAIGGMLITYAAARNHRSPRQYARAFFARG